LGSGILLREDGVWRSGNALVSMNEVALHRARLVLGWVTSHSHQLSQLAIPKKL